MTISPTVPPLAPRIDLETPPHKNRVSPLAARSGRGWKGAPFRFATALFLVVSALTGALLPGFTTPASAQTAFGHEQLKSFGKPSIGGYPVAELIQGSDGALYGTASQGGSYGNGTVFKLSPNGSGFTVLKNFDAFASTSGGFPVGGVIQGSDGALYGTTGEGGSYGGGTVFKLNTDGTGFTVLKAFDSGGPGITGSGLSAGLVQGADGALYGTTTSGGTYDGGTVFKVNRDGTGFAVLQSFDPSTTGGHPSAGLMQGRDRALYGTIRQAGSGYGMVFKVNPDGGEFTVVATLPSSTVGDLMQGADGALYGTTVQGGSNLHYGTVFKLNTDGSGFTVLQNFGGSTGSLLYCKLMQGPDDTLYGTAHYDGTYNGGTVFKLNPDGTGFSVLHNFDQYTTGAFPMAGVIQGTDGALYGTTTDGYLLNGINGYGTVFKLNPDGTGFTVLKKLSTTPDVAETGGYPLAGVIEGADGACYGTTSQSGPDGYGTVFKLNRDGTGFTVLHNFDYHTTGASPQAALIQGADGALYGTTSGGGTSGGGTAFKLNRDGTAFTVLQNFEVDTTGDLVSGLMQGTDGALYGTASRGGSNGYGTVFKLNLDGTGVTILKSFDGSTTSGSVPYAGLIQGTDGALYGTAYQGGSSGYGIVFKLDLDGNGFTILQNFDYYTTGGYLQAGLMLGTDGTLYGTTRHGGSSGYGTLFKLKPDGTGFTVLLNFDYHTTGALPQAALIQGGDGALYGTTTDGGTHYAGTAFKLNPDGTGFTVLLNFDYSTIGGYSAGLVQGTDGNLYSTTSGGGDVGIGTVFRLVAVNHPSINALTPASVPSGSGAFTLIVEGSFFDEGAVVRWNGADIETTFVSGSQLAASVTSIPTTTDLYTALITVRSPDGSISSPEVFVVTAANVGEADSNVAEAGESVSVSTAPAGDGNIAGISATLTNAGDPGPVTITAAIYNSDPSPGTAFEIDSATGVVGEFMDLQVTGADEADTMSAYFYYPVDAIESETSPTLKYYDGAAWVDVISSGGAAPEKDTTDNLDGTVSGGRLGVAFDNTSRPQITELGGTYFAVTVPRPPLGFDGFLAPIGGADSSGGSFANPVRTFKAGSTIPIKFRIARGSTAVLTGVHRLHAVKYSDATTAGTPIDATPQGAATSGNQFVLTGHEWHFNLDTNTTGLTKGIWQLTATLSDGSHHQVWIQIK